MSGYSDKDKESDYQYFKSELNNFYSKYGHCYLAIKDKEVKANASSIPELIQDMENKNYETGSYLIQECNGDESSYTNTVMRLVITA